MTTVWPCQHDGCANVARWFLSTTRTKIAYSRDACDEHVVALLRKTIYDCNGFGVRAWPASAPETADAS